MQKMDTFKIIITMMMAIASTSMAQSEIESTDGLSLFPTGYGWRVLKPNKVAVVAGQLWNHRDHFLRPHIDDKEWRSMAAFEFDLDILMYQKHYGIYWNNKIHLENTHTPRHVGWEWELGFSLGKKFQAFHYHHSRHITEHEAEYSPLYDSYGIRLTFYGDGKK